MSFYEVSDEKDQDLVAQGSSYLYASFYRWFHKDPGNIRESFNPDEFFNGFQLDIIDNKNGGGTLENRVQGTVEYYDDTKMSVPL